MALFRFTKRRILTAAAVLVLLVAGAVAALLASEWTYIQHLRHYPAKPITDVDWYKPKQRVPGGIIAEIPVATPEQIQIDAQAISNALHYAEQKHSAALLILHQGRIVAEKYWDGQTAERWTDSASMAKTITALLIGIAIEEGKIASINEPAARYLPAWSKDARHNITIGHLLSMHSGLRPNGEYEDPFSDACYLALGTNLRYVVDQIPAVTAPGTTNDYNNVNYQALGFVLEAATGQSYAAYLSEKLWQPLGNAEAALWLDRPGGAARSFGYLFATPRDWARVGLLMLNGGKSNGRQLVSTNWLQQLAKPSPTEPDYGYGLWIGSGKGARRPDHAEPFAAEDVIYLDGRHKQRVYIVPSRQLIVVRVGEQARGWDEAYLVNVLLRGLR
ncbi:MAG TPA: serine hydrolase [Candidatus Sulfotelmatobacter sp.]|nr:serine hydrolase [Candidatus Sulfotelmatobacter sp.]